MRPETPVKVQKSKSTKVVKKKPFRWTEPRKQCATLVGQGKSFMEIVAMGFSLTMTSIVMNAMKNGEKPPQEGDTTQEVNTVAEGEANREDGEDKQEAKEEDGGEKKETKEEGKGDQTAGKSKPLVATTSPKIAPIIFKFAQREIILDPFELHDQYRYYVDLARADGGIKETFSEVLTLGMQVLWVMHQNVPLTTNMLKAIFTGAK